MMVFHASNINVTYLVSYDLPTYLHSIYLEKEAVLAMMDQFLAHPGFIHTLTLEFLISVGP